MVKYTIKKNIKGKAMGIIKNTEISAEKFTGQVVLEFISDINKRISGELKQLLETSGFSTKTGELTLLNNVKGYASKQVLACGISEDKCSQKDYLKALTSAINKLVTIKAKSVFIAEIEIDGKDDAWKSRQTARVVQNSLYKIPKVGLEPKESFSFEEVLIVSAKDCGKEVAEGMAIGNGMMLTRELGDLPSNICTPSYLEIVSMKMAQKYNLEIEVLGEKQMEELGMHSLLSVSKGSIEAPKMISIGYNGGGNEQPIVLVGKGVTFDSGGISLKPGANMDEMKYDMCGAASVLGTMQAIAEMKAEVNLRVVVPTVENMPAHNASKPGDVVKSMNGKTIEILNTDAEGRLILCDALTYVEKYEPKVVIDVATLTGAVIVALGSHHSGLMANDDELAGELKELGDSVCDSVWQLPLDDDYKELIKSNFADLANIGTGGAGSVTAAVFLSEFTEKYKWAHLDIAGTASVGGDKKGATGRPVPLLSEYVLESKK